MNLILFEAPRAGKVYNTKEFLW